MNEIYYSRCDRVIGWTTHLWRRQLSSDIERLNDSYALNTRTQQQRADSDFRIVRAYGFYFRAEFVQEGVYWFLQLNTHIVGIQLRDIRCRFAVGAQFRCFDLAWRARGRSSTRIVNGIEPMDRRVTNEAGKASGSREGKVANGFKSIIFGGRPTRI